MDIFIEEVDKMCFEKAELVFLEFSVGKPRENCGRQAVRIKPVLFSQKIYLLGSYDVFRCVCVCALLRRPGLGRLQ